MDHWIIKKSQLHQKNRNSQTPSPTQNWPHEVPLLQAPGPTQVGVKNTTGGFNNGVDIGSEDLPQLPSLKLT